MSAISLKKIDQKTLMPWEKQMCFFYVDDRVICKSKVEWGEGYRYGY